MARKTGKDENADAISDAWRQSQEAFFRAQAEFAETFTNALSEMSGTLKDEAKEPIEAWQKLISAWMPFGQSGEANRNWAKEHGFEGFSDAETWKKYAPEQMQQFFDTLAQGPRFADLSLPHHATAEAYSEMLAYQQAAADTTKIMQQAWRDAYQLFSENHTADEFHKSDDKAALEAWLETANKALLDAQGSKAFLDAQKRLLNASTKIQARQRDMAESWCSTWQLPTRTEIDDLEKTVHTLKRELRKVKQELARLKKEDG